MSDNNIDFVGNKNYDDVFLRDLYSALSYFFIDVIKIKNVVNEKIELVSIPIIPSFIGDENFLKDFFIKYDKICCGQPINTLLTRIPSGRIISSGNYTIDDSVVTSNGVRIKREENVDNEFINEKRLVYSRNTVLGLNSQFTVEFRLPTAIDRFKVFQSVLNNFHKERTFHFSSCGIHRIPASVVITNQYKLDSKEQFKFADFEGYYSLNVSFDFSTFYVVEDSLDKLAEPNKVFDPTVSITNMAKTVAMNNNLDLGDNSEE